MLAIQQSLVSACLTSFIVLILKCTLFRCSFTHRRLITIRRLPFFFGTVYTEDRTRSFSCVSTIAPIFSMRAISLSSCWCSVGSRSRCLRRQAFGIRCQGRRTPSRTHSACCGEIRCHSRQCACRQPPVGLGASGLVAFGGTLIGSLAGSLVGGSVITGPSGRCAGSRFPSSRLCLCLCRLCRQSLCHRCSRLRDCHSCF